MNTLIKPPTGYTTSSGSYGALSHTESVDASPRMTGSLYSPSSYRNRVPANQWTCSDTSSEAADFKLTICHLGKDRRPACEARSCGRNGPCEPGDLDPILRPCGEASVEQGFGSTFSALACRLSGEIETISRGGFVWNFVLTGSLLLTSALVSMSTPMEGSVSM